MNSFLNVLFTVVAVIAFQNVCLSEVADAKVVFEAANGEIHGEPLLPSRYLVVLTLELGGLIPATRRFQMHLQHGEVGQGLFVVGAFLAAGLFQAAP